MSPLDVTMTRVLFDAHQLGRQQTGNETYVRELLRALRDVRGIDLIAAAESSQQPTGVLAPPVGIRRVPSNGLARLAAMAVLARRHAVDVVHAIYFLPPATGRPTVLTVHDISFERFPEYFSRKSLVRDRTLIRVSAKAASRVITVSETSRRDLLELYGLPEERVVAIANGVSPQFTPAEPAADSAAQAVADRGFLNVLAVGTLQPRKNLIRLIDAISIVGREMPVRLRVVGPDGHQASAIRARLGSSIDTQILGWLDDDALADEYRRADVFVYPSLYEGFGLPVVEAMACGTPVVTSTGGSLPEVAGDAALIVDPLDIQAIAAAILRIAQDASLRRSLRERGLARAQGFTWTASAERHAEVYEDLVTQ